MAIMIWSLDQENPLHLHANDSNCSSIVSVKVDYVASVPFLEQWDKCDVVVLNWILSSLSQDVYLVHVFLIMEESHRGIPSSYMKSENPQVSAFVSRPNDNNKRRGNSNWNKNNGHPNGTLAKITHVRNLRLSNNVVLLNVLVLLDVLVVLEYCISLLSVHKLIKDSKLSVSVDETTCYIQDLKKETVLGTGSESDGLHLFDNQSNKTDVSNNMVKGSDKFSHRLEKCVLIGDVKFYQTIFPYKMSNNEPVNESSEISTLNIFDRYESEPATNTPLRPNDDEERPPGRDGRVHQPDDGAITDHVGHDGEHFATPIGDQRKSEGNVGSLTYRGSYFSK
ncbi:hypothetical protein Tco_0697597 [Tanacetum coccineum]